MKKLTFDTVYFTRSVLVVNKFNKFYNLTLLQYHDRKPGLHNFTEGKFFGTRFGSWEELIYAVNVRMISCKYIDNNAGIEKIGTVILHPDIRIDGYGYLDNTKDLLTYYLEELPVRMEKSKNAEKFPDLAFVSKHLIDMKHIIESH